MYSINNSVLLFIGFGIAILVVNGDDISYKQRYDTSCNSLGTECVLNFTLTSTIHAPVYFYYGLTNFYQSNRLFYKWKSTDQLYTGKQISSSDA